MADRAAAVLNRAAAHLVSRQRGDGGWEGEVVWCTMILSQYVIVRHVTGRPVAPSDREPILRHYATTRTPEGGWPLHPEGPPLVFTTALAYVALRLLGVGPDEELTARARSWLHDHPEGVPAIPTWGKFWLAMLGLYGDAGVGAFPPELFLLPRSIPGHPSSWYCHTRYIYLAMSYLSGRRFKADLGPLRDGLRKELYREPYERIDFTSWRDRVARSDLYARPRMPLSLVRRLMSPAARLSPARVRARALTRCLDQIVREQKRSAWQTLSPVNGLLNCLALYAADASHPHLQASLDGLEAWRWSDEEEGVRFAGARSHVWDTAFAARALTQIAPADSPDVVGSLRRAHEYLRCAQIAGEFTGDESIDREPIEGGWCFSDGVHRWPVSDCTAEALSAILAIERLPGVIRGADRVSVDRVRHAVRFILARQNADGGFSTYERARGGVWLDGLNPSEMFRDCMVERSYVECTASVVEALALVRQRAPEVLPETVTSALERAVAFLRRSQRPDGAFPAAWGIQFTYGIFHAVKGLRAAGVAADDPAFSRAAQWLRRAQRDDGGWGEHFSGCLEDRSVEHPRSQPVMTAWALLALAEIDPESEALRRGAAWLASAERDGCWRRDAVNGVFFGTAMLEYRLYAAYFPLWALARAFRRDRF